MKTMILKTAFISALLGLAGCGNSPKQKAEDLEKAEANVVDAKQELSEAIVDSTNAYHKFRAESEARLRENDRKIAELKSKWGKEKKAVREKYEKSLEELERKNEKLKARISENKESAKDKWESFKQGFNKDLDELGKSISAFAKKL